MSLHLTAHVTQNSISNYFAVTIRLHIFYACLNFFRLLWQNYCFFLEMLRVTQGRVQSIRIVFSVTFAHQRLMQESMAPMCWETYCYPWCHQAYNSLTTNQTRHAKSCVRTITWKCSQHGNSVFEIVIRLPPFLSYLLVLLLQVNHDQSTIILFDLVLLT